MSWSLLFGLRKGPRAPENHLSGPVIQSRKQHHSRRIYHVRELAGAIALSGRIDTDGYSGCRIPSLLISLEALDGSCPEIRSISIMFPHDMRERLRVKRRSLRPPRCLRILYRATMARWKDSWSASPQLRISRWDLGTWGSSPALFLSSST